VLSIGEGCETTKTVVHELLHLLGMFHEQTRYDRDLYVKIFWWNMQRGKIILSYFIITTSIHLNRLANFCKQLKL